MRAEQKPDRGCFNSGRITKADFSELCAFVHVSLKVKQAKEAKSEKRK